MFDILSLISGKKKLTMGGWHSFNAVCCHHRGHKVDKRLRGGIRMEGNKWSYHCFNCQFSCGFELGRSITVRTKQMLNWLGVDDIQIQRWSLESLQNKDLLDFTKKFKKERPVEFEPRKLPDDAEILDVNDNRHKIYIEYLINRKVDFNTFDFYVTPDDEGRNSNRIIIPYTYNNEIVGYTSRFLDNRTPRYINIQQADYVFGYDQQKNDMQVCILVEGIFDALSIGGCALTHNDIGEGQARVLRQLQRQIIYVPDRDEAGMIVCDSALELGYSVSIPEWDKSIKDVNDAVIKYGKLPTLLSILQSATTSKIKIEMQRKKIVKGL